jgi:hypothetical protein
VMSYWVIFLLIFVLESKHKKKLQQIKLLVNNKVDLVKRAMGVGL